MKYFIMQEPARLCPGSPVPIPRQRLFMCSRDIQVGDKITYPEDRTAVRYASAINSDGTISVKGDMESLTAVRLGRNEVIKVIGEVSPKAIWIKKDMELELKPEDFRLGYYRGEDYERYNGGALEGIEYIDSCNFPAEYKKKFRVAIQFKCSNCETFH